ALIRATARYRPPEAAGYAGGFQLRPWLRPPVGTPPFGARVTGPVPFRDLQPAPRAFRKRVCQDCAAAILRRAVRPRPAIRASSNPARLAQRKLETAGARPACYLRYPRSKPHALQQAPR